jgi:hydrogenase maturation protein HypF
MLKKSARRCFVGLGGELNNTSCILFENKAFISQHIGDVENVETRVFLENATKHLIRLTNSKVEAIACDLHPKFTTTKLAHRLAEENGWQLIQVQHHHAHIAGLMAEHNVDEMMGICCDGHGYGTDGEAWGGEILLCIEGSPVFKRLAHLERQPLIGGDLATRYPMRIAAAILSKKTNIEPWLMQNSQYLPHGEKEAQVILGQIDKGTRAMETTSCGRVLDAVAAVLGVCFERTYEGEPAMKLESAALNGKDVLGLKPAIDCHGLRTTDMLYAVFENRHKYLPADLAYSAHLYLAKGLAKLAIDEAMRNDVKTIGFSGGAACNQILTSIARKVAETSGLKFLVHETIPSGDGGISFGQAVVGGYA